MTQLTTKARCEQKVAYDGSRSAKDAAWYLRPRYGKLKRYKCNVCDKWHLTKKDSTMSDNVAVLPVVRIERSSWMPMETAPKDRQFLARRHNDVMHEYYVVWWSDDREYPWQADHTAYPEGRLDEWAEIPV